MIYKCGTCGLKFNENDIVYYGQFKEPGCLVCGDLVAGKKPADLPQAGASAESISSVVRNNATAGWISVLKEQPE